MSVLSAKPDISVETVRTKLRLLGRYRLIVELGRGDFGIVYSAVEQGPVGGKAVVVKVLRPELASEPAILHAFLEQAWLAVRLDHPNVVQSFEAGDEGGHYFVAMEYLEGQTLQRAARALRREGRAMPRALHLRLVSDMLLGLHYAHELRDADGTPLNVVHRGVSPRNVFLTYDGHIKLVDFGVAKVLEASHQASVSKLESKAAYMAPEQLYDAPSVDRRADVFAAGIMLWEALTGRDFWDGVPGHELLARLMRDALPPLSPSSLVPDLPPELDRICVNALASRREGRYPTALAFREAIEQYIMASGEGASAYEVGRFVAASFVKERPTELSRLGAELARAHSGSSDGGFAVTPPIPRSVPPLSRPSGKPSSLCFAQTPGHGSTPPGSPSTPPERGLPPPGRPSTPPGHNSTPPGRPSAAPSASKRAASPAPSAFSARGALLAGFAVIVTSATLTTGAILAARGIPLRARSAARSTLSAGPRGAGAASAAAHEGGAAASAAAREGGAAASAAAREGGAASAVARPDAAPSGSVLALHVHVSPEHARVFLDGEELPLAARNGGLRARDGRPHLLLAEAEGYQPRSQTLLFNSDDVALDIMLAKQAPHAAPGASAPGRPSHRRGPRPLAAPTRKPGRHPSGGQASAPPAGVQAPAPPSGGPEELGRPPPPFGLASRVADGHQERLMTSPSEPSSGTTPDEESKLSEAEAGALASLTGAPAEGAPADDAPPGRELAAGAEPFEKQRAPGEGRRRRKRRKARAADEGGEGEDAPIAADGETEAAGEGESGGEAESEPTSARGAGEGGKPPAKSPKAGASALGELREIYLRVDRRLLGLFRIYFGFVLLFDVLRRVPEATFFYSSSGVLSNHYSLFAPIIKPYFSLYTAFSTTAEVRFAFFATALVHVFYIVGYRTKLMQVLAFALYAQLNARNTFIENGGTVVFSILACWTMFLPLGDRFSVDALRRSLRARREHTPEALDDRAGFRAEASAHYSLVMVAIIVQIAAIYFFNTVHKTGVTWRRGESIHWVLWQNRIATHLAAFLRMHEPSWLSPLLSKLTLIIEGAAPILVFSPFAQKYLRTTHVVAACALHLGIAALMTLGPFSYVMVGLNLLVLPSAVFDWAATQWAARKARLLVAYDPNDAALHQLARVLARLDSLDRLRFVAVQQAPGGPLEGGSFFVRDDAGGEWLEGPAALITSLRSLPFGSLARMPPARALADRFFARRPALTTAFDLRPGRPDAAPGPAADRAPPPPSLRLRLTSLGVVFREGCVAVLLAAAVIQISRDNSWVPRKFRFEQPELFDAIIMYPRMMQGWRMFSPDAPRDDGTLVIDAVTADGRHIDPLVGGAPDFNAALHGPWYQSQLWCDYYLRISWDNNSGYREELKKYLFNWHRLEHRPAEDRIKSFDIWWVTNDSPPPGSTTPFNINKRLVASSGPAPQPQP